MTTKEARKEAVRLLGEDAVAYHLPKRPQMQRYFMGNRATGRSVFGPTWESCVSYLERNPAAPVIQGKEIG